MPEKLCPAGGAFLIEESAPRRIFIPEMLDAEARLMGRAADDFMRREVLPVVDRLEAKEDGLMETLLRRAGGLGLLAGSVDEPYGGLELPKTALVLLAEKAAPYLSFAISAGVHSGVAMLPLLYFGTPEQKQQYLPRLASGELIGAFALSEANSGSDALGAQTRAALTPDGSQYLLNGEKMWTTNGGFADLFIVFAQADGQRFTAFLVEKATPGLVLGREEHKMGLHGSSTRRILLQNAPVPVANVIGEVGKGHYSALYALNVGRFNIGATALGAAKECLRLAAQYAKQRVQFGQPIANFGLIQQKLAEMAAQMFLLESMIYRVAGYFDSAAEANNTADGKEGTARALSEEYAIECAIIKFFGTEVLAYVVDEALQIHGGFGYSEEFPIARMYRDARIFRIFEGANEINRLAVLDQLLRRHAKGRLALFQNHVTPNSTPNFTSGTGKAPEDLTDVGNCLACIRQAIADVLTQGRRCLEEKFGEQQEVAAAIADMSATLFALESAWLRACRLRDEPALHLRAESAQTAQSLTLLQVGTACAQTVQAARAAFACFEDRGQLPADSAAVNALANGLLSGSGAWRRQAALAVLEAEGYPFA